MAVAGAALVAAAAPAAAVASKGKGKPVGALYTETNGLTANAVVAFDQAANGKLTKAQVIGTGGTGGAQQQPGCTATCPILDTDSEVSVTPNGKLVFAVNAGSNTISTFTKTSKGLKRVGTTPSGGVFPDSITTHGNVLYVLNINSDNIAGFTFSPSGRLTPIVGSVQPLSTGAMPGLPRQIGFDNTGSMLVVTLLGPPILDTFEVSSSGVSEPAVAVNSSDMLPFGFAFAPDNTLVVSNVASLTGLGSASTYTLSGGSAPLTPIDGIDPTMGHAPCWVSITKDGRYVYVVNTGGGAPTGATITEFSLYSGHLTKLGVTPATGDFALTDSVLSKNDKYLYVLAPSIKAGNTSHIQEWKVGSTGILTHVGSTPMTLAVGVSGLAGD